MSESGDSALSPTNDVSSHSPATIHPASTVVAAPLADQVFDTLRGWIVNGQLPPDYRLRIRDIAAMVGTSVMPVREAVRRLVEAGLAIHEPYKGARVRGLDVSELEQAYDVRILLESECARLGAAAAGEGVCDRMQEHWLALEDAARAGDVLRSVQIDEELLDTLYAAGGNEVLRDIVHGLWDKCRPYKVLWASDVARRGEVHIWHYKPDLIAAVRAKDADQAAEMVRRSYTEAKAALHALLDDPQQ
ncbi:GntR family transcriptional regulator [Rhodococcus sp. RDE2]|uniref:GntR family transcriptional regulator n=1 Tax=Rhodococcus sp. RDE2 TaxID=2885078 RepID=UPI001E30861F|nr:GntR family transcriptional regulator [Rhodococcus sp. RDE2]